MIISQRPTLIGSSLALVLYQSYSRIHPLPVMNAIYLWCSSSAEPASAIVYCHRCIVALLPGIRRVITGQFTTASLYIRNGIKHIAHTFCTEYAIILAVHGVAVACARPCPDTGSIATPTIQTPRPFLQPQGVQPLFITDLRFTRFFPPRRLDVIIVDIAVGRGIIAPAGR